MRSATLPTDNKGVAQSEMIEAAVSIPLSKLAWTAGLVLVGLAAGLARAETAGGRFDRHSVVLGDLARATVLTGRFLGNPVSDLAAVYEHANGQKRVRLFAFDGSGWHSTEDARLPDETRFVDVANIAGQDRIVFYTPGRLGWFDPDGAAAQPLLDVEAGRVAAAGGEIPRIEVMRDLQGSGRQDLALPTPDGFWVSLQRPDGSFAPPMRLGPPEPFRNSAAHGESLRYGERALSPHIARQYQSRLHALDFDQDGRHELVFWNSGRFDVYRQNERGAFDARPATFPCAVPIDAAGEYSLMFGFRDESTFRLITGLRGTTSQTALHSLRDVNGDGVADLVTSTRDGRSLLRLRSRYDVHLGTPAAGGIAFDPKPTATFRAPGRSAPGYSWMHVYADNDAPVFLVVHVPTTIGNVVRTVAGNSVRLRISLHRAVDGAFPASANVKRTIRPKLHPFGRRGPFFPAVLIGDATGDGLPDLFVGSARHELLFHGGVAGPEMFAQPDPIAVDLPDNEGKVWLADLTGNGRQDLLAHLDLKGEPGRLEILLAR